MRTPNQSKIGQRNVVEIRKKDSLGGAQTAVRITRRDIDSTMSITPQENCWSQELMPENTRPAQNENGIRGLGSGVRRLQHDSINGGCTRKTPGGIKRT